jgi:hypothetical protein
MAASLSPLAVSATQACASSSLESACASRPLERPQMLYSAGSGFAGSVSVVVAAGGMSADDSA